MDKRALRERDICTKFITPALGQAGWGDMLQIREEVGFPTHHHEPDAVQSGPSRPRLCRHRRTAGRLSRYVNSYDHDRMRLQMLSISCRPISS